MLIPPDDARRLEILQRREREARRNSSQQTSPINYPPPSLLHHPLYTHPLAKMVKLEEVLDEEFNREQSGPQVEDEWDTSDESEASEDEEEYMPDETFADRLAALKDIVPPTYRKHLSNTVSTTSSWLSTTLNYGGKTLWVVSTSVLLLGVPWALAFAEEQQMAEMEREMKMQQSANELLTQQQQSQAKPAL
ncbi:hypothetical protein D6C97_07373 [Aureobasidium pullulans]|nr:hypothetical protein D6C97_07373 [Aureobasidium pullulans]